MLHEVNGKLHELGYDRLEELLDPAGYSGLLSRSMVDRFDRFSRALVQNRYHNGYPDLLPRGAYPGDAVQHGQQGGLEVKASRYQSGWQSHGPRAGWFCVVQFALDRDAAKALHDREPTTVQAVYVAELEEADWSWQPAAEGRIRSGTASVTGSGELKLRLGAVWIDPTYERDHAERVQHLMLSDFGANAEQLIIEVLESSLEPLSADEVATHLAGPANLPAELIRTRVVSRLRKLASSGEVIRPSRGKFASP